VGFGKKGDEESRSDLVKRLKEEGEHRAKFLGQYIIGPEYEVVTNDKGVAEKSGLKPNTLYLIIRTTTWRGEPMPQED